MADAPLAAQSYRAPRAARGRFIVVRASCSRRSLAGACADFTRPTGCSPMPARWRRMRSDGLTTFRARPRAVVLAESQDEVDRGGPAVPRRRRAVHGARQRHEPLGRRRARSKTASSSPSIGSTASCGSTPRRDRGGRAGRGQPRRHRGGRAARPLLRARSLEPVGLHHRRQRRLQLRRRALLPPRHDRQSRARPQGRAARTARSRSWAATASSSVGPGSGRASSSGRRDSSASRSRSRCG